MRALTAREVQILDAFQITLTKVTVTGVKSQPSQLPPLTLGVITQKSAAPKTQTVLPKPDRRYKQYCNPNRSVNAPTIWAHESPIGPNGQPILSTTGYIPSNSSGVTVGYGIDLGTSGSSAQAIAAQLTTWGISAAGLQTLQPFLGLTGAIASAAIAKYGAPTISTIDAQTISTNAMSSYVAQASSQFGRVNPYLQFEQLPQNSQTALADLAYWAWTLNSPALPSGLSTALGQSDLLTAGQLLINTGNSRLIADGRLFQSGQAEIPKPGVYLVCGNVGP